MQKCILQIEICANGNWLKEAKSDGDRKSPPAYFQGDNEALAKRLETKSDSDIG